MSLQWVLRTLNRLQRYKPLIEYKNVTICQHDHCITPLLSLVQNRPTYDTRKHQTDAWIWMTQIPPSHEPYKTSPVLRRLQRLIIVDEISL